MKRIENITMTTDRNRELELETLSWEGTFATPEFSSHGRKLKLFQTPKDINMWVSWIQNTNHSCLQGNG